MSRQIIAFNRFANCYPPGWPSNPGGMSWHICVLNQVAAFLKSGIAFFAFETEVA